MENPAKKRLIRKLELQLFLSQMESQPTPKVKLEQYTVSETIAANMLYLAAYINDDIVGKKVLDLGCGTGRLGLGASYLGASAVVGVDIDKTAIIAALKNSKKVGSEVYVKWVLGDIASIRGSFDTVLQNPPFGVQKHAADRKFLEKALEVGNVIYSLHNHPYTDKQLIQRLRANPSDLLLTPPSPFIKRFVESHDGIIKAVYAMLMTIPRIFDFHTKPKHSFVVDLYFIKKREL
jgi:putative methylase